VFVDYYFCVEAAGCVRVDDWSTGLARYFWEKDFFGGSLAIRAFSPIHVVEGLTVWAFDSSHFVEVFIYYLHPFFLQFFFALEFRGLEDE